MTLVQNHRQQLSGNKIRREIVTLSKQAYKGALSVPLLDFKYFTPAIDLNKYNALIITSKEAVKALDYLDWKDKKVYCVGMATAELVNNVAYCQNSGGAYELTEYLKENAKDEKLLYCRGEKVSYDVASILNVDEIILYKSFCINTIDAKISDNSTIIFSSPSTVSCFLQHFKFKNSFRAIALGKTTALSLIDAKIQHIVSPSTKILDAIEFAKSEVNDD